MTDMTKPIGLQALELALSQVGVRESNGNNDGEPSIRYCGGRREPWCAHFVAWVYATVGRKLPGHLVPSISMPNPIAAVKEMFSQCEKNKLIVSPIEYEPGDIIFFNSRGDSDTGSGWHVGIVVGEYRKRIHTVEGNSANKVARRSYEKTNPRIMGFARPSLTGVKNEDINIERQAESADKDGHSAPRIKPATSRAVSDKDSH